MSDALLPASVFRNALDRQVYLDESLWQGVAHLDSPRRMASALVW